MWTEDQQNRFWSVSQVFVLLRSASSELVQEPGPGFWTGSVWRESRSQWGFRLRPPPSSRDQNQNQTAALHDKAGSWL